MTKHFHEVKKSSCLSKMVVLSNNITGSGRQGSTVLQSALYLISKLTKNTRGK